MQDAIQILFRRPVSRIPIVDLGSDGIPIACIALATESNEVADQFTALRRGQSPGFFLQLLDAHALRLHDKVMLLNAILRGSYHPPIEAWRLVNARQAVSAAYFRFKGFPCRGTRRGRSPFPASCSRRTARRSSCP